MRSGPERTAGIDRDRVLVRRRLLPGRHDPDAAGAHRTVTVPRTLLAAGGDRARQLLENAFVGAVGLVVRRACELLEQPPLLVVQPARNGDVDEHALVASSEALEDGHPASAQHPDLTGLRALGELELRLAVQGRHGHRRSERRLGDRQIDGREDLVSLTHEARVGLDAHLDVDVAGAGAASAGMALAGDPNLLAVMDSGRDLDLERSFLDDPALAAAVGAGLLDPLACAPAGRTGLRADELAEGAPRDPLQAARAAAGLTGDRARARRGSTARAGAARDRNGERNLPLDSARSLDQLDLDLNGEVRPTRAFRTAADAEEVVAEERCEQIVEAAEVELRRREAAAAESRMPEAVVQLARLPLRERLVGLDDLAKTLLRIGCLRDVGMELAREPAEGPLYLSLVGLPGNAEHLVVVPLRRCHQPSVASGSAINSARRSPRRSGRARRRLRAPNGAPSRSPSARGRGG